MEQRELESKIDKIIRSNVEQVPHEGAWVDTIGLQEDILRLIYEVCPHIKQKHDDTYDQDEDEYYVDCGNDGYNGGNDFYS